MLDGIIMEKLAVPSAFIRTEPFISTSNATAVPQGIPDYPFVTNSHPIAATEKTILSDWVDNIVDDVEAILLTGETIKEKV